jgi:hypothetical protein
MGAAARCCARTLPGLRRDLSGQGGQVKQLAESETVLGPLLVTSYYGGPRRGPCLQFTPTESRTDGNYPNAQLGIAEVRELVDALTAWLAANLAAVPPGR